MYFTNYIKRNLSSNLEIPISGYRPVFLCNSSLMNLWKKSRKELKLIVSKFLSKPETLFQKKIEKYSFASILMQIRPARFGVPRISKPVTINLLNVVFNMLEISLTLILISQFRTLIRSIRLNFTFLDRKKMSQSGAKFQDQLSESVLKIVSKFSIHTNMIDRIIKVGFFSIFQIRLFREFRARDFRRGRGRGAAPSLIGSSMTSLMTHFDPTRRLAHQIFRKSERIRNFANV